MLLKLLTRRGFQIALLIALLAAAVIVLREEPLGVRHLRNLSFDSYNNLLKRKPGAEVAIVDIDEASLRKLGQWPWPRTVIGDIPLILREMGAKSVTFDMVFAEPDRTSPSRVAETLPQTPQMAPVAGALRALPDNDAVFAQKIARAGNVVMGFVVAGQETGRYPPDPKNVLDMGKEAAARKFIRSFQHFATSLPEHVSAAAGNGSFSIIPEEDGIVRSVPLMIGRREGNEVKEMYPALSLEALRVALGREVYKVISFGRRGGGDYGIQKVVVGDYEIPTDESGAIRVYYAGHRKNLYIPAWELLERKVDPARVKDKIIFVGTSAIGLLDIRSSPVNLFLPGVEVHAEIVEQILHGQFLRRTGEIVNGEMLAVILVSLCVIFLAPFVSAGVLALVIGTIIAGGVMGGFYAYETYGLLIDPLCPAIVIVLIFIASSILTNLRTEMEKRMIRKAFDQYLSPRLIEELVKNPDKLKLGGDVRELTVMFTDIRNFTTISESMDPGELIRMMNDFLTPMTSAVLSNGGFVDKYMGDAMMTFWNAPVDDPDHARNACRAALEMVEALRPVNAELKARAEKAGRPFYELKAGIGLNSGRASVGNMGSKQRFAYSALGDTVNLASRVEGQTKMYGVTAMLTQGTYRQASEFACIEIDLLAVKGRNEPERVYALLGGPDYASSPSFRQFADRHALMLSAYRAQNWEEAGRLGQECAALQPELAALYDLYAGRIKTYRAQPPGPGWTGLWVAKDK